MRTLHAHVRNAHPARRGVALLLALLLLVVLIAITIQISVTTGTDARIARNDLTMSVMDLSVESALLQVGETLKTDADSTGDSAAAPGGAAGAAPGASPPAAGGAGAAPGGQAESCDSQRDEWHEPQRTTVNDIQLRIFVQDEDSKYNVLNMLAPDEKEAQAAFDRVVRILDNCREGSREYDIDARTADEMAKAMLEHMRRRKDSKVPRPRLLSDVEDADEGLPQTLEEFAALQPFEDHHFRDFRDRDDRIVHSIASFLTVWTSLGIAGDLPQTAKSGSSAAGAAGAGAAAGKSGSKSGASGSTGGTGTGSTGTGSAGKGGSSTQGGTGAAGAGGTGAAGGAAGGAGTAGQAGGGAAGASSGPTSSGGYAVNVNTAPAAVLKSLFDDREVPPRFFDKVLEYRNLEEEKKEGEAENKDANQEKEPELDEYGQEKFERRIFDSIGELGEVEGYKDLPAEQQSKINQLLTTTSNVFTIFVVARRTTSAQGEMDSALSPNELRKKEEKSGDSLVRVVRSVVWRHKVDDEVVLTPIVRWEILDYLPFEVLDFPPDDR
ncbi:MAG: hypothetical protein NTY35_14435 [Planctomycetota bacterium]|nr:hypothetical protein [Planctomycetota bacterium]